MTEPITAVAAAAPPADRPADSSVAPPIGPSPNTVAVSREKPRGQLSDVWFELRRKPLFWISSVLILLFVVMAVAPQLFTPADPAFGDLRNRSLDGPDGRAWFGFNQQGQDVFARCIYGARASMLVALVAVGLTVLIGGAVGVVSGFYGGWLDTVLSRVADVFFGLPFVLGAIVILSSLSPPGSGPGELRIITLVILSIVALSWPLAMRIMRSSVLAAKNADYVVAARALGAGPIRIIFRHLLPNCLAPLLVYSTILIGSFIGAEATLSFLGVGLRSPVVSWGVMISESQALLRVAPELLIFPASFLVAAVLSFVMLGEAVREALDPKLR